MRYCRSMFQNRRAGKCRACGVDVPAGAGWCFRADCGWDVSCRSRVCGERLGLVRESESDQLGTLDAAGVIRMAYRQDAVPVLRSFPGARWDAAVKVWRVSVEEQDRPRVLELADRLGLRVAPELRRVSEQDQALRVLLAAKGLYRYQVDGVLWLHRRSRALLADDQGLGKCAESLLSLPEHARAVVVCPASLKYNWSDEVAKWRPDLRASVLSGRGSFRLPEAGEVVLINYDVLPKEAPEGLGGCYLIVDEASAVKSSKTARHKAVKALAAVAKAVWFLSGTPLMNRPFDLWGVLSAGHMAKSVFSHGDSKGSGWTKFLQLFSATQNCWGGWEFGNVSPEVPERLRRVMLRRMKEEVLPDLPAIRYQVVRCGLQLKKAEVRQLDEAWDRWCGESLPDEEGVPEGLPAFEDFSAVRALLARSRIPDLLDLVEQYEETETPVLVFSAHRAPIDELAGRDGWAVITGDTPVERRQDIVRRFQAGGLRGVGLTIRAGGYGLTLTRASHAIFVDLDWTPAMVAQAEDRIRRIGQKASGLLVTRLVSDHPLDLHVLKLLDRKIQLIKAAVDRIVPVRRSGAVSSSGWRDETVEEQETRAAAIAQAEKEVELEESRQRAGSRVRGILVQERARACGPERELTDDVKVAIRESFDYLLSVCDGAFLKDGQGFNKPDARRAQALREGIELGVEDAWRASERMLTRYRRQLAARHPGLFAA